MAAPFEVSETMEPVAIIGMACRWPGDARREEDIEMPSALWEFLSTKGDAYREFPADRINIDSWYHPHVSHPGSFSTRGGCFLKEDLRNFDPTFFGISPQETLSMDPAQRKFLETVFEAFESSGTPLDKISGSKTGCFVGNFNYDHQLMQYRDTEYPEPYGITGGGIALLSNRVSYLFNLRGPSLTLDTACSSSMYALHLACLAIQSGECTAAVVGGSNLILTPECQVFSSALGALSKTSQCHTFDIAADGYARADGIGALYVKSLRQAIKDNDPVRAVIRGIATNANGRTSGITHPDPDGQESVIRRAYERAGNLDPALTSYFECHGTGTPVGDPLEVEAVGRVFAKARTVERPLLIGSIKSNMGHCEAASGIAGIMKSILALENGVIPPIRLLQAVNPNVDLHGGRLHIVQESTPWPGTTIRRASVNSFGYGGSNAHTVLEEAGGLAPNHRGVRGKPFKLVVRNGTNGCVESTLNGCMKGYSTSKRLHFLLPFSAHDERTLRSNMAALERQIDRWELLDLAFTLGCRRSFFPTRAFAVVTYDRGVNRLDLKNVTVSKARSSQNLNLGFVFTGQGAQWPQMGKDLMKNFPIYLKSIRFMDQVLGQLDDPPKWSIEESLYASSTTSQVYHAALSQPLVTAVQIALVDLLNSWNVKPTASVGHSSGEIGAAYASGRITAAEAIIIAYARGRAVSRNTRNGAMLAVGISAKSIAPFLADDDTITIACYNSPESITLSGDRDAIILLKETLNVKDIFARIIATDGKAYHSQHMRPLVAMYERELDEMLENCRSKRTSTTLPLSGFISSTDATTDSRQMIDTHYWQRNLVLPVTFGQALATMIETSSIDLLLEIGPHTALRGPIRQIARSLPKTKFPEYVPTLIRSLNGATCLLDTVGTLFSRGSSVDLMRINALEVLDNTTNDISKIQTGYVIVDLPKYQWQYDDPLYLENRWTREWRLRSHPRHDILGSRSPGGNLHEPMWRNIMKQKDLPWLQDHKIGTDTVFPASGYIAMALEATLQMAEIKGIQKSSIHSFSCQDIHLEAALIVPEAHSGVEVLFNLRRSRLNHITYYGSLYEFTVTSVTKSSNEDVFSDHAHGLVGLELRADADVADICKSLNLGKPTSAYRWYNTFTRVGLHYGRTFQGMSHVKTSEGETVAKCDVEMLPTRQVMPHESRYIVHPAALDSTFQLAIIAAHGGRTGTCKTCFIPVSIKALIIRPTNIEDDFGRAVAHSKVPDQLGFTSNILLSSIEGKHILEITDLRLLKAEGIVPPESPDEANPFTRMIWKPEFDFLTNFKLKRLYPPTYSFNGSTDLPKLEQLALRQLLQFHAKNTTLFRDGSSVPHLQRFLDWMTEKVDLARQNIVPGGTQALGYSIPERDFEIQRLSTALMETHGPETTLMCHMYDSLPSIYLGEVTGIQAALQNHYLDDMYAHMALYHRGNAALRDAIVLMSHKNPNLKILEVGGGTGSATREILPALRGHSMYRGYDSYTFTDISTSVLADAQNKFKDYRGVSYAPFDMELSARGQGFDSDYDLVLASNVLHATSDIQNTLINIRHLLKPQGKLAIFEIVEPALHWNMILGTFSDVWKGDFDPNFPRFEGPFLTRSMWIDVLPMSGFNGHNITLDYFAEHREGAVIITTAAGSNPLPPLPPAVKALSLIYREIPSSFALEFQKYLTASGYSVNLAPLVSTVKLSYQRVISLVEADSPLFPTISLNEWQAFKNLVLASGSLLWVTKGSLLEGVTPEYAMMSGIASTVHTEMNFSRLLLVDLEQDQLYQQEQFENLTQLEERAAKYLPGDDFEFRSKSGILHIGRLMGDDLLNVSNRSKAKLRDTVEVIPLTELKDLSVTLAVDRPGVRHETQFEVDDKVLHPLEESFIEIQTKAACLNDKFVEGYLGLDIPKYFSSGHAGLVTAVGSAVTQYKVGDRIFGLSFGRFGNLERIRASSCLEMEVADTFEEMAAIPSAFCTAIYGLLDLGRLGKGETVLIHSAATMTGLAACRIAVHHGAKVLAAVESPQKKRQLLETISGIQEQNIIMLDCVNPTSKIFRLTENNGVDVIFSNARGETLQIYWKCLAMHGRFIDIRFSEVLHHEQLNMDGFLKNASFASLDLELLSQSQPSVINNLMMRIKGLKLEGVMQSLTHNICPIGNIDDALSDYVKLDKTAEPVFTFDDPSANVRFRVPPHPIHFAPDASYLLIGCLGGLGRSFATWMVSRGAKKLVFLSRSGSSRSAATNFVARLQGLKVDVQVVKGDVSDITDVRAAIAASGDTIKGVVQAPLSLKDAFFSEMTLEDFNSTVRPRVVGTLNLHQALKDTRLDFFVMWSSWTATLGSASQSNYAASCAFMDAFAMHRQNLGMPATSLTLGQILDVGLVSDSLQYQENLLGMGLYGNSEDEFLQYCAASIGEVITPSGVEDTLGQGHLLAGVEAVGLQHNDARYPVRNMSWSQDPRFSCLVQATRKLGSLENATEVRIADDDEKDPLLGRIHKRIARLLYVAADDIDVTRPINTYGIDSMIAAELGNWIFATFGAKVTLLNLLQPTMSVEKLTREVEAFIQASR